jgi:eukaryotic-like serine/threonine-protein kinase
MDRTRWNRIEEILQAALDVDTGERAAFVRTACGSDVELHRDVTALLASGSDVLLLDPPEQLASGREISHYRIEERIGAGGMGEVYRAYDERLRRTVALKTLPAEFMSDPRRLQRFQQEAFAASRLNHPNIVTIFETLRADGADLIAIEYVEGQTLREMLTNPLTGKPRKLPVGVALDVAAQVAAALQAAHTAWIIHRDVKPENIMVRSDGLVKVLDFGIAKLSEERDVELASGPDFPPGSTMTIPGAVLGTTSYMSPEQARGEPLDGRTDIYSLGVVLHEMVTGERRFGAAVPKPLDRVLRRMLDPDRDRRYASAGELLADLKRVQHRIEGKRARRLIGVSGLTAIVALALTAVAAILSVSEVWDERVMRDGHTAAARHVAFSPDGRLLVSCGEDGRVIVWDFARRQRLATLNHPAYKVAFSPDGRSLATGGTDGAIVIWDPATWRPLRTLRGERSEVGALAFSPDGSLLAAAGLRRVVLWDARRGEQVRTWRDVGTTHGTLLFSPDARHLVSSFGFTAPDLLRGGYSEGWSLGNSLAVSPDGTRLAAVTSDGAVTFHRLAWRAAAPTIELIVSRRAHHDHGRSIAYSPDGRLLASGAEDVVLWDALARQKIARFEYPSIVWCVAFSPDGRWLISTHGDGAVLIWDVAERALVGSLNEHSGAVRTVAFSPDGRRLVSAGEDQTLIVWNAERGGKEMVLSAHQTRVNAVAARGSSLASADQDGLTMVWDMPKRQPRLTIAESIPGPDYCVALSPDGRYVANTHALHSTVDGSTSMSLIPNNAGSGHPYGVAFSADGRLLAAATDSGVVLLWDVERRRLLEHVRVPNTHQICVSFAPDGKSLVTGEDEGAVRLWSVSPLRETAILGRHAARVKSVAFAPDGRTVASAGDDKMIALWDVRARTLRARIGTHASPVYAIAFSPDGRRLASGEHDRSVRVYTRRRWLWRFRLE